MRINRGTSCVCMFVALAAVTACADESAAGAGARRRAQTAGGASAPEEAPGPDAPGVASEDDATTPDPTKTEEPPAKRDVVAIAIAYGESLVGTPYGWWYSGPLPPAAPMWTAPGPAPAASTVTAASANCAGLTNLMLRAIGKPLPSDPAAGTGGTGAYGRYYANVAKPFDVNASYPAGTLIGRHYRDTVDQGHVAVVLANGRVLQSFADVYGGTSPGVNTTYTVAQSHDGGFYEYAVLPGDWLGN